MDVFQGVADNTDSHVDQVGRSHLEHVLGELLTILVDLLNANTKKNHIRHDKIPTKNILLVSHTKKILMCL